MFRINGCSIFLIVANCATPANGNGFQFKKAGGLEIAGGVEIEGGFKIAWGFKITGGIEVAGGFETAG